MDQHFSIMVIGYGGFRKDKWYGWISSMVMIFDGHFSQKHMVIGENKAANMVL